MRDQLIVPGLVRREQQHLCRSRLNFSLTARTPKLKRLTLGPTRLSTEHTSWSHPMNLKSQLRAHAQLVQPLLSAKRLRSPFRVTHLFCAINKASR